MNALPTTPPSATKTRVLSALKSAGGGTVTDLAGVLGITVPAARRHLQDLCSSGLASLSIQKPAGRGRPCHVYSLTGKGEQSFPHLYAELCKDILYHLENLYGEEALLNVFDARSRSLCDALAGQVDLSLPLAARVEQLAECLCQRGYEARVMPGEDGGIILEQGHCPSLEVARGFVGLCQTEVTTYETLLAARVTREARIASGAVSCRYRVWEPVVEAPVGTP